MSRNLLLMYWNKYVGLLKYVDAPPPPPELEKEGIVVTPLIKIEREIF